MQESHTYYKSTPYLLQLQSFSLIGPVITLQQCGWKVLATVRLMHELCCNARRWCNIRKSVCLKSNVCNIYWLVQWMWKQLAQLRSLNGFRAKSPQSHIPHDFWSNCNLLTDGGLILSFEASTPGIPCNSLFVKCTRLRSGIGRSELE